MHSKVCFTRTIVGIIVKFLKQIFDSLKTGYQHFHLLIFIMIDSVSAQ